MTDFKNKNQSKKDEDELPLPWQRIQGAVWLIGLAIIALKGWWWPGILVVIAISGLVQGAVQLYLSRQEDAKQMLVRQGELEQERLAWLPDVCPNCGGPISAATVRWTGPNTAD